VWVVSRLDDYDGAMSRAPAGRLHVPIVADSPAESPAE